MKVLLFSALHCMISFTHPHVNLYQRFVLCHTDFFTNAFFNQAFIQFHCIEERDAHGSAEHRKTSHMGLE